MNENQAHVCLVDHDESVRQTVERLLEEAGIPLEAYRTVEEFLEREGSHPPGCVVTEVDLHGLNGLDLQQELVRSAIYIPIIFLAGNCDISTSVRAMKAGAIEFLTKPIDPGRLLSAIHEGMMSCEYADFQEDSDGCHPNAMVGACAATCRTLRQIAMVAPTDSTVLIQGETGTGKELIAQEIHRMSRRKEGPLVRVNCASIPKELYESEFFGHVRGSFTGAIKDRVGRFEAASGGTLFLDEIGEVPLDLQSKLLRALQEKQFERVGDEKTKRADVRIVAATNRDLKQEVAAGRFREDLYYRLNVFPVTVPPLRERREDIPALARYFVEKLVRELKCPRPRLTAAGVQMLESYSWPGNVRELRNVIERAIIMARGKALDFDLPQASQVMEPERPRTVRATMEKQDFLTELEIQRLQRENLRNVLQKTGGKIMGANGAAELMGIKPTTLISRAKKLGLRPVNTMGASCVAPQDEAGQGATKEHSSSGSVAQEQRRAA
jgi:DNA-binding NtrC family response regulator